MNTVLILTNLVVDYWVIISFFQFCKFASYKWQDRTLVKSVVPKTILPRSESCRPGLTAY